MKSLMNENSPFADRDVGCHTLTSSTKISRTWLHVSTEQWEWLYIHLKITLNLHLLPALSLSHLNIISRKGCEFTHWVVWPVFPVPGTVPGLYEILRCFPNNCIKQTIILWAAHKKKNSSFMEVIHWLARKESIFSLFGEFLSMSK